MVISVSLPQNILTPLYQSAGISPSGTSANQQLIDFLSIQAGGPSSTETLSMAAISGAEVTASGNPTEEGYLSQVLNLMATNNASYLNISGNTLVISNQAAPNGLAASASGLPSVVHMNGQVWVIGSSGPVTESINGSAYSYSGRAPITDSSGVTIPMSGATPINNITVNGETWSLSGPGSDAAWVNGQELFLSGTLPAVIISGTEFYQRVDADPTVSGAAEVYISGIAYFDMGSTSGAINYCGNIWEVDPSASNSDPKNPNDLYMNFGGAPKLMREAIQGVGLAFTSGLSPIPSGTVIETDDINYSAAGDTLWALGSGPQGSRITYFNNKEYYASNGYGSASDNYDNTEYLNFDGATWGLNANGSGPSHVINGLTYYQIASGLASNLALPFSGPVVIDGQNYTSGTPQNGLPQSGSHIIDGQTFISNGMVSLLGGGPSGINNAVAYGAGTINPANDNATVPNSLSNPFFGSSGGLSFIYNSLNGETVVNKTNTDIIYTYVSGVGEEFQAAPSGYNGSNEILAGGFQILSLDNNNNFTGDVYSGPLVPVSMDINGQHDIFEPGAPPGDGNTYGTSVLNGENYYNTGIEGGDNSSGVPYRGSIEVDGVYYSTWSGSPPKTSFEKWINGQNYLTGGVGYLSKLQDTPRKGTFDNMSDKNGTLAGGFWNIESLNHLNSNNAREDDFTFTTGGYVAASVTSQGVKFVNNRDGNVLLTFVSGQGESIQAVADDMIAPSGSILLVQNATYTVSQDASGNLLGP